MDVTSSYRMTGKPEDYMADSSSKTKKPFTISVEDIESENAAQYSRKLTGKPEDYMADASKSKKPLTATVESLMEETEKAEEAAERKELIDFFIDNLNKGKASSVFSLF